MYRPWSLRAARRAADNLSLRPLRDGFEEPRATASRAGASRVSARAIDPSDLRIALTSLLTEPRRGLGNIPPRLMATDASYYGTPELARWLLPEARHHSSCVIAIPLARRLMPAFRASV